MMTRTYLTLGLVLLATLATAGTQVKGSIVPVNAAADPKLSHKSTFGLKGTGDFKVTLKDITDSAGMPAGPTTGTTPDTQYWVTIKIDAQGTLVEYNVPFSIVKAGQAKLKASVGLISLVPVGSAVGIVGFEVHEPTSAASAADCTTLMNDPTLPGVYLVGTTPNPCTTGARVGLTGISTGQ